MSITSEPVSYPSLNKTTTLRLRNAAAKSNFRDSGDASSVSDSRSTQHIRPYRSSESKRRTDTEGVTLGLRAFSSAAGCGWMTA